MVILKRFPPANTMCCTTKLKESDMLQIIRCTHCNEEGMHSLHLKFDHYYAQCGECSKSDVWSWKYWFCNSECMFTWLQEKEIEEKGFPCQSCWNYEEEGPTGFTGGFKSNGVCRMCKGTKRVKERVDVEDKAEFWGWEKPKTTELIEVPEGVAPKKFIERLKSLFRKKKEEKEQGK
jgi:hypothetical protein